MIAAASATIELPHPPYLLEEGEVDGQLPLGEQQVEVVEAQQQLLAIKKLV